MNYEEMNFVEPQENLLYFENSNFVIQKIKLIINDFIKSNENKIIINTNLRSGLPMENINKISAPIIEAWAFEKFDEAKDKAFDKYFLKDIDPQQRLDMADIVLHFLKDGKVLKGFIDVKATATDIKNSGRFPNITSFSRIRTAYTENPDYLFLILSLKYKVYSDKNTKTNLVDGIMEVTDFNVYDLKYVCEEDLHYNPALGTGQVQMRDIHNVGFKKRSTWEFCRMLDKKFLNSTRKDFSYWHREALKNRWIIS